MEYFKAHYTFQKIGIVMTFLKQTLPDLHFNYTLLTVPDSTSRGVIEIRTLYGCFFSFS